MESIGQAALDIVPRPVAGFDHQLERGTNGALVAAGSRGGKAYGDAAGRSMLSSLRSHAATAAKISAGILVGAGYAAFRLGQSSLAEARESQKVGALTEQVIKTTGQAAGVTAKQVGDLSTALSLKTGVDDEVIQRGANMLLTFKSIRNEVGKNNDIFNQGVAITEDMAAAMAGGQGGNNLDLKSSSIQVGKALNDPIKGITALKKVGVDFNDQQKKQIEQFEATNRHAAAQKVILHELQSEFGGAAAAQATLGEKVDVAWGNVQEKLGTALLPLVDDVERALLRKGIPAAEKFIDWFQTDGVDGIHAFIDETRPLVHELMPALVTIFGDVRDTAKDALPYVKGIVEAFNDMPEWAQKGLVIGGAGTIAGNKISGLVGSAGGGLTEGAVGSVFDRLKPMPVFVTNPGFGTGGAGGALGGGKVGGTKVPGGALLPGLLTTVGLAAGVTYASKDSHAGDNANPKNVGSYDDFMRDTAPQRRAAFEAWMKDSVGLSQATKDLIGGQQHLGVVVGQNDGKVENYGRTLGRTGLKKVNPHFTTPGLPESKNGTQQLLDNLTGLDRSWRPRVDVNTGDSLARINAVRTAILGLPALGSRGNGLGVLAAPKTPKKGGGSRRAPRQPVKLVVGDGRELSGYVDDLIAADRDLDDETQRAGR